jgi:hypothetical protein
MRMQLFAEIGMINDPDDVANLRMATAQFFTARSASGLCRSWVATSDQCIVGTATLAEFRRPPYLGNLSGREAYLLNVFTVPAHRRQGIDRSIV